MKPWTDEDVQAAIWLGVALGVVFTLTMQGFIHLALWGVESLAKYVHARLARRALSTTKGAP